MFGVVQGSVLIQAAHKNEDERKVYECVNK